MSREDYCEWQYKIENEPDKIEDWLDESEINGEEE